MGLRVLIVDDHEMVRTGLTTALELEDDIVVVGQAASGEEALARLAALTVDVVLLDLLMPGMGGIAACREIRDLSSATRVLMLTSSSDDEAVVSALMAGASGYLLKNVGRLELLRAIRLVAQGKQMLDPEVTEAVTNRLLETLAGPRVRPALPGPESEDSGPLSEREVDVLRLVARGFTNKEIAAALIIAEKTARNHISRILDKLGMARRSQAAAWAIEHGLLPRDP